MPVITPINIRRVRKLAKMMEEAGVLNLLHQSPSRTIRLVRNPGPAQTPPKPGHR